MGTGEMGWRDPKFRTGLVIQPEANVSGNSPRQDQSRWSCPSDRISSEVEFWDFMYGLVRILKPATVFEAGCHLGYTSYAIAKALHDNAHGELITCDPVGESVRITQERCEEFLFKYIFVHCLRAQDMIDAVRGADICFIDGDVASRNWVFDHMKPGALAVIHDTYVYPDLGEKCRLYGALCLDTPRGFALYKKPLT